MTFFDWLATPAGVDLVHAIVILMLALASYLTFLTHRQASKNERLLNNHLEHHVMEAIAREPEDSQPVVESGRPQPNI